MTNTPHDDPSNLENPLPSEPAPSSRTGLSEEERAAALNAGHEPISQTFIVKAVLILAAVLVVGLAIEHFLGNTGTPRASTSPSTLTRTTTTTSSVGILPTPTENLLGLRTIAPSSAAAFTLTDQVGRPWSLTSFRGHAVVLTFFDANCQDICPVLGAEVRQADQLLSAGTSHVIFAIVNTNPLNRSAVANPPALVATGLAAMPNVYFLNGSLAHLNSVWSNYGVRIRVDTIAGTESHNNVLYFISSAGTLKALAVPFGNQDHLGRFSLSAGETHLFAQGIAQFVTSLGHS